MTLLHIDGFDHYATADVGSKGWAVPTTAGTIVAAAARTGVGGYRTSVTDQPIYLKRGVAAADEHATFTMGFAYRPSLIPQGGDTRGICALQSDAGATNHIMCDISNTGAIRVWRGDIVNGTVIGSTAGGVLVAGVFSYIEIKVFLSDTVGTVDVRNNNASVLALTGQDTKNAGTKTVFDTITIGQPAYRSPQTGFSDYDDFYLCNGAGSVNNTFLGDSRVRTLVPNGNGNSSQLLGSDADSVNNYLLVDEATPDVADYVGSATDNQKDLYAFSDLTETAGVIRGVQDNAYAAKTDAGARSLALVTRTATIDYDSTDRALGISAAYIRELRELNPNTGLAWTIAEVTAAQWGVKVRP